MYLYIRKHIFEAFIIIDSIFEKALECLHNIIISTCTFNAKQLCFQILKSIELDQKKAKNFWSALLNMLDITHGT